MISKKTVKEYDGVEVGLRMLVVVGLGVMERAVGEKLVSNRGMRVCNRGLSNSGISNIGLTNNGLSNNGYASSNNNMVTITKVRQMIDKLTKLCTLILY